MKRREFIGKMALGAAALPLLGWPESLLGAAERPPYSARLPETPFDAPKGSWTLAVLPDTQNYSQKFPDVYNRQCEWIVAHREKHNILFVAHEGDLTNNNNAEQWQRAHDAMSILTRAKMPYALVTGNHDHGEDGHLTSSRATLLNDYFTESDYSASQRYGLFESKKMQNSWHEFETPSGKFLMLALEYGPRDAVVDWAKQVLADHHDHRLILLTHAYLYSDSTRYDATKGGPRQKGNPKDKKVLVEDGNVNDGQNLWDKLVARHPDTPFTLNGHVLENGTGYLASKTETGRTVHQILANYQGAVQIDDGAGGKPFDPAHPFNDEGKTPHRPYGGGGFLRLMQFYPDRKTVKIKTYSPWYDRWLIQPDQQFDVALS